MSEQNGKVHLTIQDGVAAILDLVQDGFGHAVLPMNAVLTAPDPAAIERLLLQRAAAFLPPSIVVNRIYNGTNDANGGQDAVEAAPHPPLGRRQREDRVQQFV